MRANAIEKHDYNQDNFEPATPVESMEIRRQRIAREAEAACKDSLDFEEFLSRYGAESGSDFA